MMRQSMPKMVSGSHSQIELAIGTTQGRVLITHIRELDYEVYVYTVLIHVLKILHFRH